MFPKMYYHFSTSSFYFCRDYKLLLSCIRRNLDKYELIYSNLDYFVGSDAHMVVVHMWK